MVGDELSTILATLPGYPVSRERTSMMAGWFPHKLPWISLNDWQILTRNAEHLFQFALLNTSLFWTIMVKFGRFGLFAKQAYLFLVYDDCMMVSILYHQVWFRPI